VKEGINGGSAMNRRQLLMTTGALALVGCGPTPAVEDAAVAAAGAADDMFSGAKLMADVEAYVGFGTHRTGSVGDLATSAWFADYWRGLGYEIEQMDVEAPNADTTVARLVAGGATFDGFAQPPLAFTPAEGITGKLVRWNEASPGDVKGKIAYVHMPRDPSGITLGGPYRAAFQAAKAAGAIGVVAAMSGPSGEVVAINTPVAMALDIPVLQLGDKLKPQLDGIVEVGQDVTLTVTGPGGTRVGKNTVARYGAEGPWIIISTPQSGWFTCGGERGPGIAMSRALAAWAIKSELPVRWLFVATSGHEWIDHGAHLFHEQSAPEPNETALWWHLGAAFGARAYEETADGLVAQDTPNLTRALMATPDLVPLIETAFAGHPVIEKPMAADLSKALGEYRLVLEEGYPSGAGFWGGNAHFHTPIDGAEATTGAIMEPIARAIAQVVEAKVRAL
jgi:hypothetical protein